jgi:hypothetical protein
MPPQSTASPAPSDLAPEISALLAAGASQAGPKSATGFKPYAVVPEGYKTEPLVAAVDPPLPDHIKQVVSLGDTESFGAYVNRYKTPDTMLFSKISEGEGGASFLAILDYHKIRSESDSTQANRTNHKGKYDLPFSPEWKKWRAASGNWMSQADFAQFIDDNMPDITRPNGADLLELALNFEARQRVHFSSTITPQSGARVLKYTEEVDGESNTRGPEGTIKVPDTISLLLPVFYHGKKFEAVAKLYYRVNSGKLVISFAIRRPHEIVENSVRDIIKDITAETGITPLVGMPE